MVHPQGKFAAGEDARYFAEETLCKLGLSLALFDPTIRGMEKDLRTNAIAQQSLAQHGL